MTEPNVNVKRLPAFYPQSSPSCTAAAVHHVNAHRKEIFDSGSFLVADIVQGAGVTRPPFIMMEHTRRYGSFGWIWSAVLYVGFLGVALADEENWTKSHEAGRCAIRGQCGKQSFFGSELPCPDNGLAEEPEDASRKLLVDICGDTWSDGKVCCKKDQVSLHKIHVGKEPLLTKAQIEALTTNLKRAEPLISSCPACKANFFNLFCTFTCSPDQSLFVNVTGIEKGTSGKFLVTELDNLWSDSYGEGFYDSCKDVKFGAIGGKAMDFIGGGAKNYTDFLGFLGEKKFLGSPFQINFPRPSAKPFKGMQAANPVPKACNDTDEAYRCACVDCPGTCPELPEVTAEKYCHVGVLPCLSFAAILVYCILLALLASAVWGHVVYLRHKRRKTERLQLLQDSALSDDEDERDLMHNGGLLESPQKPYKLNTVCDSTFNYLGRICARYPLITIGISVLVVIVLSIGWINFEVETNPERLWVSPSSDAAKEKTYFDKNFGPFYRAEQAFVVNDTLPSGPGPVLSYETLAWWFDVEQRVQRRMSANYHATLGDVCFNPTGQACVVESVTGYFASESGLNPDTWASHIRHCAEQPGSQDCLPDFQQPLKKDMILGGFEERDPLSAQAFVTTWVVNNYLEGTTGEKRAEDWEEGFKNVLQDAARQARDRGLRLSFSTEKSLTEELNQTTNTDAKIVVISYIIMFLYASLALGSTTLSVRSLLHNPANAMVQSKFSLGVIGILIVLMSVSASVGLFSACKIRVTLIIAEVIPFLVLAVGVDNIFLIVHEFERVNTSNPDDDIETRMGKALGRMGPSILLSATTETIAFALGAAVGMPAVKNFAIYAAGAVVINALLQITMFVAALALNQRRVETSRADCFPCVRVKRADVNAAQSAGSYGYDDEGPLQRFIRKVYAPFLLNRTVKVAVVVIFLGLFAAGLALIPEVSLGLDQRIALPQGSYLINYFDDLDDYFNTGPPVYFVVHDLSVEKRAPQQELCGRFSTCASYSLTNVLEQEAKRPEVSYLTGSTASWIDDYFTWLNPSNDQCCVEHGKPCFANRDPPWNVTLYGMPQDDEFIDYLTKWIAAPTNEDCPFGGAAPYSTALVIHPDAKVLPVPASHFRTSHTALRSQSALIQSYASARRIATEISDAQDIKVFPYSKHYIFFDQYTNIISLTGTLLGSGLAAILVLSSLLLGSIRTGLVVTITVAMIITDIIGVMALANVSLNAISLVNLVISVGIAVEFCAHIARAFQFPSRSVMEKSTASSTPSSSSAAAKHHNMLKLRLTAGGGGAVSRDLRAWTALVNVGGSVFSGITITKILGVTVLAFTRSKIFEIYYFRVWVALVVFAATHALIWLPVMLSLVGGGGEFSNHLFPSNSFFTLPLPSLLSLYSSSLPLPSSPWERFLQLIEDFLKTGYVDPESDGSLEEDLAARRYRALLPDDDEYDSDDY